MGVRTISKALTFADGVTMVISWPEENAKAAARGEILAKVNLGIADSDDKEMYFSIANGRTMDDRLGRVMPKAPEKPPCPCKGKDA